MNSFTLFAIGNLMRDPERTQHASGDYTRFCLIGNDPAGSDSGGKAREFVTSVWFVAFGGLAEYLAHHAHKGDQLIVQAQMRTAIWTGHDGERRYDHSFVVQQLRFGAPGRASRAALDARQAAAAVIPF